MDKPLTQLRNTNALTNTTHSPFPWWSAVNLSTLGRTLSTTFLSLSWRRWLSLVCSSRSPKLDSLQGTIVSLINLSPCSGNINRQLAEPAPRILIQSRLACSINMISCREDSSMCFWSPGRDINGRRNLWQASAMAAAFFSIAGSTLLTTSVSP